MGANVGSNHRVAEGLEVLRHPLALGRRLQQNPHWASPFEHGREAIAGRRDASVEDLTILRDNPDLTVLLMQIDGTTWTCAHVDLDGQGGSARGKRR